MTRAATKRRKLFGSATSSRGAAKPGPLGDRGAIAVEFALIFPAVLLMFAGVFGIGVVMIEDMQLTFVVQRAALATQPPSTLTLSQALAWAQSQLPEATFSPTPASCITGQWPVTLGVFPTVTLSQSACLPS